MAKQLQYDTESAMAISKNPYQGVFKRVLCICSGGILRSATTALVLSLDPWNFNTRCAGINYYALIPVTKVLLHWADEIVVMTDQHKQDLIDRFGTPDKPIHVFDIPDYYAYRQDELIQLIDERAQQTWNK